MKGVLFFLLLLASVCAQTVYAPGPTPALVFSFDSANGNTVPNVGTFGAGLDGTLVRNSLGSPGIGADGKFGNALYCGPRSAQDSGFVQLAENAFETITPLGSYTIMAWVRPAGGSQLDNFLRVGNSVSECVNDVLYSVNVTSATDVFLTSGVENPQVPNCYGPSSFGVNLLGASRVGQWLPVAISFNRAANTVVVTSEFSVATITDARQWDIVARQNGTTQYGSIAASPFAPLSAFLGSIDEFRVYEGAMDASIAQWLYYYPYTGALPNISFTTVPSNVLALPVGNVSTSNIGISNPIVSSSNIYVSNTLVINLYQDPIGTSANQVLMVDAQNIIIAPKSSLLITNIIVDENGPDQTQPFVALRSTEPMVPFDRVDGRDGNGHCLQLTGNVAQNGQFYEYNIQVEQQVTCSSAASLVPTLLAFIATLAVFI